MNWQLTYTRQAKKDAKKLALHNLKAQAAALLELLANNPYQTPPSYEKLVGDLSGAYSRRNRLIYQIIEAEKVVKILRMWSHYE